MSRNANIWTPEHCPANPPESIVIEMSLPIDSSSLWQTIIYPFLSTAHPLPVTRQGMGVVAHSSMHRAI
jgi:hypothetical protein